VTHLHINSRQSVSEAEGNDVPLLEMERRIATDGRNMGEKKGDKGMKKQIKGTVLMQRGWKGDRNNEWRDNSKA
jgi:hypothetical protein